MITITRDDGADAAAGAPDEVRPRPPRRRFDARTLVRGRAEDPPWVRPALLVLLGATAVLYLWGLGASGWANTFYSAAVQAGTKSWKAMFFGSSDAAGSITVDKPPLFLWPMEISARIFGLSSWSVLVPQALEGVAAVGVLYAAVKRWFGASAGLLAGVVLALTPIGAVMFRFNNPDAMLVLLMTCAAYALVRALERGSTRWLMGVGAFVGLAFLAKSLQALLVLPGFGLAYLLAGPPKFGKRIWQLLAAGAAMIVAGGWWVAIVQLWPKSSRPYIGGSQNNSLWNVIFGYNGLGRLTGNETGSVGGGGARLGGGGGAGAGGGMWGKTGWLRLFNSQFGGEAAWLIPAALVLLVGLLGYTLLRPRTDRTRAAAIMWGGWLLVSGLTFSLSKGIIHPYYTVALGPGIAALVGIGAVWLWGKRSDPIARSVLSAALVAAALMSWALLRRVHGWYPWLRTLILVGGFVGALALLVAPLIGRRLRVAVAALALVVGLVGPGAYTIATAAQRHTGAIPSAGPAGAGGFGFGGRGGPGGFGGQRPPFANGQLPAFGGTFAGGAAGGTQTGGTGRVAGGMPGGAGGAGGLLNGSTASAELVKVLNANKGHYTWVAAATGSNSAAGYQLATGSSVMPIGGFNGSDPSPTLAQFKAWVAAGKIHYYIGGGGFGGGMGGGSSSSSAITSWVQANFTAKTVGSVTLYDLTAPTSSATAS
jgi:4-amino-4-deoxy-L-arabinose transferase-like glycosyltransferase